MIEIGKNIYKTLLVSIDALANKSIECPGEGRKSLDIPKFQRGLVWSPAQVELLWDSVMRGIPIGCITLMPYEGNGATYGIFDGQQRYNALRLGCPGIEENDTILWLDLAPSEKVKERCPDRKFFFYVTTKGQPWGYHLGNPTDSRLSTAERCHALRRAGFEDKITCQKPEPSKMYPFEARCPIPFRELRRIGSSVSREALMELIGDKKYAEGMADLVTDEAVEELRRALALVETYRVIAVVSPVKFDRGQGTSGTGSDVATYFARLNKGGTEPSQEDVRYSILKSILPAVSEIDSLDSLAVDRMNPARLADIALRLYFVKRDGKWKANVTQKDVYQLAAERERFFAFIAELRSLLEKFDKQLLYSDSNQDGMPRFVLASIARSRPDIYLLLLWLEYRSTTLPNQKKISLLLLLGLYGQSLNFANLDLTDEEKGLKKWLHRESLDGRFLLPPPPSLYESIEKELAAENEPGLHTAWNNPLYVNAINRLWAWNKTESRLFLLYCCRGYMQKYFANYDSAAAAWLEDNRPWDYDHIYPSCWITSGRGRKKKTYTYTLSELISSIGNIAPLPFSFNRSKQDTPPFINGSYMKGREDDELLFVSGMKDDNGVDAQHFNDGNLDISSLEEKKELAFALGRRIAARLKTLYTSCYQGLCWNDWLNFADVDWRPKLIENFCQKFECEPKYWVYVPDGTQRLCDQPWGHSWIAVGEEVKIGEEKALLCICCGPVEVEWGVRRHPEENAVNNDRNTWWHSRQTDDGKSEVLCHNIVGKAWETVDLDQVVRDLREYRRKYCR